MRIQLPKLLFRHLATLPLSELLPYKMRNLRHLSFKDFCRATSILYIRFEYSRIKTGAKMYRIVYTRVFTVQHAVYTVNA